MTERKFTDAEKIAELRKEITMRKRVFPRWVADGRMKQADADRRIAILEEIAAEYDKAGQLPLDGGPQWRD